MNKKFLFLSLTFNATLVAIIFYFCLRDAFFPLAYEFSPQEERSAPIHFTNSDIAESYVALPFEALIAKLEEKTPIEEGYKTRDLALSALVTCHHVDVCRALAVKDLSKRSLALSNGVTLTLFPGLTDADFQKITKFLKDEKWPLTSKGLFLSLKKLGTKADPTLVQAMLRTPQFHAVELLFQESSPKIQRGVLLSLITDCHFELLADYFEMCKQKLDLSLLKRQEFLISYLENGSKTAAALLILMDKGWVIKQLDDTKLTKLLELLPSGTTISSMVAKEVYLSARGDRVKKSAERLIPETELALIRPQQRAAIGELRPVYRAYPPMAPAPNQHIIQPGESLWTISKKYKIPIDTLMKHNQLKSSVLKPGGILRLPPTR